MTTIQQLLDSLPTVAVPADQLTLPTWDETAINSPQQHGLGGPTLRRLDRKYVLSVDEAEVVFDVMVARGADVSVLTIGGHRVQRYETKYLDLPNLILYEVARARRPDRCKIRVREYQDTGDQVLEVKHRGRDGVTSKFRRRWEGRLDDEARLFLANHLDQRSLAHLQNNAASFVSQLVVSASTRYTRAALRLEDGTRLTVDRDLGVGGAAGVTHSLPDQLIVETKSVGAPTEFDRLLWLHGCRPTTISKYALAVAAAQPTRPTNRWARHTRNLVPLD